MISFKTIIRILGSLLMLQSVAMFLSALVAVLYEETVASHLAISASITFITGIVAYLPFRKTVTTIGRREGYIIVTGAWITFSLFGSLPFMLSGAIPGFTDAFFETISGFTTTGASILIDIEALPKGLLFWRSLTQWLGGMGIVVLSLAIIGEIKIGNFQLFAAEVPGVTKDKLHPKVSGTAKRLWIIYSLITLTLAILLKAGGMSAFDSINHAFTTMATGGYSTKNASIAAFDSVFIHSVITIFMLIAGVNFALIYFVLKGKPQKIINNDEFRFYISLLLLFSIVVSLLHWGSNEVSLGRAFSEGSFQVVSIITSTGFATADYVKWGPFLMMVIFLLMFTGGSTGSTGGGIKMLRLLILARNSRNELHRIVHPNAVIPVRINGKALSPPLINNVLAFIVIYFLIVGFSVIVIAALGYDLETSFGAVAATIGNIGPGIGEVGPVENYSHFPGFGKWYLSFLMLTGRLELFTVLILFSRSFYKS